MSELPKRYQGICPAALHKSCWGATRERFYAAVCSVDSGDCFHRLSGKPLGKKDIEGLTEPEVVKFLDHGTLINAWRFAKAI